MSERALRTAIGSPTARRGFAAVLFEALYESRRRRASLEIQRHRHLLDAINSNGNSWGERICVAASHERSFNQKVVGACGRDGRGRGHSVNLRPREA